MAPLTMGRAKWWAVALPVISLALTLAILVWGQVLLPRWSFTSASGRFTVSAGSVAYGVSLGACVLLAALLTGRVRTRAIPTLAAVLWACLIGAWVDTADTWAWGFMGYSTDLATTSIVLVFVPLGAGTAAAVGWMANSRRVALAALAPTLVTVTLFYSINAITKWMWMRSWVQVAAYLELAPVACWQVAHGIVLGQFVVADARRRSSGSCLCCGYSLSGLPAGSPCPECGPIVAERSP